jgi:hypothetical protein
MRISTTAPTSPLPGVYVQLQASPKAVGLVPSDIIAVVGEFSRGPVDTPLYVESLQDIRTTFGPITPNPNGAVNTPLNGYMALLALAQQGVQRKIAVRVGTASLSTAFVTLFNGASAIISLLASTPGTWANNSLQVTASNGSAASSFNLAIRNNATGENEYFANLQYADLNALVRTVNATSRLVVASLPLLLPATVAPTASATGADGTIPAGVYYLYATYTNANGETTVSPEIGPLTVASTNHVTVTLPTQTGATGGKLYATTAGGAQGSETFVGTIATLGSPVNLTSFTTSALLPPSANTATVTGNSLQPYAGVTTTLTFPVTGATPASGTAPGSDGANAPASRYVGVQGTPSTGVYSLVGLVPHPNLVLLSGTPGTDTTQWTTLAAIGMDNDWVHVSSFATGTSKPAAITSAQSLSALQASAQADFLKLSYPGIKFQETELYNTQLLMTSHALYAGISAVQPANMSAANKPLFGVSAPEYILGNTDREDLINANINAITANVVRNNDGSSTWGLQSDRSFSGRPNFEVRMQALILENFGAYVGQFVQTPNTPAVRAQVSSTLKTLLDGWAADGLIPANPIGVSTAGVASPAPTTTNAGQLPQVAATTTQGALNSKLSYVVLCDDSNNVLNGITSKDLIIDVQVTLFPNIERIIFRASIGATVQITLVSSGTAGSGAA